MTLRRVLVAGFILASLTVFVPRAAAQSTVCGPVSVTCPPAAFGHLDIPLPNQLVRANEYLVLGGWIFQCNRAVETYAIELDDLFIGAAHFSGPAPTPAPRLVLGFRPDVSAFFQAVYPACAVSQWSGFGAVFAPGELSLGTHTIRVWGLTPKWFDVAPTWYATEKHTIIVTP